MVFQLFLEWGGAITGLIASLFMATNSKKISKFAWPLWILSGLFWIVYGVLASTYGLLTQQFVSLGINILGAWRWFVKKK